MVRDRRADGEKRWEGKGKERKGKEEGRKEKGMEGIKEVMTGWSEGEKKGAWGNILMVNFGKAVYNTHI